MLCTVAVARPPLAQGEESGHTQKVLELRVDCDKDVCC
jgi:phosphoribosyl-AMP cyclohydrolase